MLSFVLSVTPSIERCEIPLDAGDFCLIAEEFVDVLNDMPEVSRFIRGMRAFTL